MYQRHEALRTRFSDDGLLQRFNAYNDLHIPVHNLIDATDSEREELLSGLVQLVSEHPFDLTQGPLLNVEVIRYAQNETLVLCSAHHIICDGWSWNIVLSEIGRVYTSRVNNEPIDLDAPQLFHEFILWDKEYEKDSPSAADISHWVQQLQNTPVYLELPTDHKRPAIRNYDGDTITRCLSEDTYRAIKSISADNSSSMFITLFSAFSILLSRICNQEKLIISTPVAGQMISGHFDLVGCCIRLLPVASVVNGDDNFLQFLQEVKQNVLLGYENLNVDFSPLLPGRRRTLNSNRIPFSEVCFNLDRDEAGVNFSNLEASVQQTSKVAMIEDMFFNINENTHGLKIDCDFNPSLFNRSTVNRWIDSYEKLLSEIALEPNRKIRQLNSVSKKESALIKTIGQTKHYTPQGPLRIEIQFDLQAIKTPGKTALIHADTHHTYRELQIQSNQLANHIFKLGVRAGERIGIHMDRSAKAFIAILAVLKTDGICVPLDPSYPVDRLAYIMNDANVSLLLTDTELPDNAFNSAAKNKYYKHLALNQHTETLANEPAKLEFNLATRQEVAFILYTSASTGKPAGVKTTHKAHFHRFDWMWRQYPFTDEDVCSQKTSLCFIDSIWEMFGPLLQGTPSVIVEKDTLMNLSLFVSLLEAHRVSRLVVVPSFLRLLLSSANQANISLPALKMCFTSGERLTASLAKDFVEQLPHCQLINLYGTTEVCGDATFHEVDPNNIGDAIPIGRAVDNAQVVLLDRYSCPVPIGIEGEICISGGILAEGYLNQPALSAKRYTSDLNLHGDDASNQAERWFKTGDLGQLRADGTIDYLGRMDSQFQIAGIRVDPMEIEAEISAHDAVLECIVELREQSDVDTSNSDKEDQLLIAYIQTRNNTPIDILELKAYLRSRLPNYMVPQVIEQLSAFPLTPNGKLDKKDLKLKHITSQESKTKTLVPRNSSEALMLETWSSYIVKKDIAMEDSFFDIADSFTLIKVISKLGEKHSISLTVQDFLRHPTLEDIASHIAPELNETNKTSKVVELPPSIVTLQEGSSDTTLVLVPPAGVTESYYIAMLPQLDKALSIYTISTKEITHFNTLESYATQLVKELTNIRPTGPFIFAGMCLGTHLAVELDRQTQIAGRKVSLLSIVDHVAPSLHSIPKPPETNESWSSRRLYQPAKKVINHLKAGRVERLVERAKLTVQRSFDNQLDLYMRLMDWQIEISENYVATPTSTRLLLIQSQEFSDELDLSSQWSELTTGTMDVETLETVKHEDFSKGIKASIDSVSTALNKHLVLYID